MPPGEQSRVSLAFGQQHQTRCTCKQHSAPLLTAQELLWFAFSGIQEKQQRVSHAGHGPGSPKLGALAALTAVSTAQRSLCGIPKNSCSQPKPDQDPRCVDTQELVVIRQAACKSSVCSRECDRKMLVLEIFHLNRGSCFLNTEQDIVFLNTSIRNM